MLHTLKVIFRLMFYGLVVLIGVTFAVSNRDRIDLTLYPLPYAFSMPIFLFAIITFSFGILCGWMIAQVAALRKNMSGKESNKRIAALENEIAALRSEQMIKPAALLVR